MRQFGFGGNIHAIPERLERVVVARFRSGPDNRPMDASPEAGDIRRLLDIMARLRDPDGGCPWDLEQSFETIAPYTIEEAYEVADAIETGDMKRLRDELGDLLFQVVFHAQMAREAGGFDFGGVVDGVSDKMIRRHPHVFGDGDVADAAAQTLAWEVHKAREREARAGAEGRRTSVLDDVAHGLPALLRARKLQERAARVGFDWTTADDVVAKIEEEIVELRQAVSKTEEDGESRDGEAISEELGDLLFSIVNHARHLGVDPETALRRANVKFERRFRHVETETSSSGRDLERLSLAEYEEAWKRAKERERGNPAATEE